VKSAPRETCSPTYDRISSRGHQVVEEDSLRNYIFLAGLLITLPMLAASSDDFYQRSYDRGISDYATGDFDRAYHELRSAAFGFVDHIEQFETASSYAAMAAHHAGHDSDARDVLLRLVAADEIEPHFRALALPASLRAELEPLAATLLTRKEIERLGVSVAVLDAMPVKKPAVVPTPSVRPNVAITAPRRTDAPETPPLPSASGSFADAQRALDEGNDERARIVYLNLLSGPALSHEESLRLADGLYRLRDYVNAVKSFERSGNLDRSARRYHYAVALFEIGRLADAKRELAAALPYLDETPDVSQYRAKIEAGIK